MAHPFFDHIGPLAFAHRGGASDQPENSLAAFAYAVDLGYRYVETDAHVTADGVVIAFHDDHLDRVTDRTGEIAEMEWSQVAKAKIDGREPIPTMAELLQTWPDLRVNIDPKHDEVVKPLADLLAELNVVDRVCIGSFSDARIDYFRERFGNRIATSMGPAAIAKLRASSFGLGRKVPPGDCVQVPPRTGKVRLVDERFVRKCHRASLPVHVWTIDDRAEIIELLDLGVDGIMTDRLLVLKEVLTERGRW